MFDKHYRQQKGRLLIIKKTWFKNKRIKPSMDQWLTFFKGETHSAIRNCAEAYNTICCGIISKQRNKVTKKIIHFKVNQLKEILRSPYLALERKSLLEWLKIKERFNWHRQIFSMYNELELFKLYNMIRNDLGQNSTCWFHKIPDHFSS